MRIEDEEEEVGSEYLNDVLVVELSIKEQEREDVKEAIQKELENMKSYEVFGEKMPIGDKEVVGTRMVVTESEKHDGQKKKIKARLVCQGFKELDKAQSDSPTAHRESLRLFLSLSAVKRYSRLSSMDISAAFLQSESLEREVFIQLPKNIEEDRSYVYKLNKPLYGLTDAGRQFWLRVRKILKDDGFKTLVGDECFYQKYDEKGNLIGMLLTHVDDFIYNGSEEFEKHVEELFKKELSVSKIEKESFRFCGLDIKQEKGKIVVSMEDYAEAILETEIPKRAKNEDKLNADQMTVMRGLAGQTQWLAQQCRIDIAYGAHQLSKRSRQATIKDLKYANSLVKKVKSRVSRVEYKSIGKEEDMVVFGFSDADFKAGEKSTGGQVILLGNKKDDRVSPILWKTKLIQKACRAPKDAETIALGIAADMATDTARQVEQILTGKKNGSKYQARLFCDNAAVLESIVSSKQVDRRNMRSEVNILKQFVEDRTVEYVSWIQDENQIADILTKDKPNKIGLTDLMQQGQLKAVKRVENIVFHNGRDYKMEGKALREKIIKVKAMLPKRKKVKQVQKELKEETERIDEEDRLEVEE